MSLPALIQHGGPVMWILLFVSAMAICLFVERYLHYHRAQIDSVVFTNGIRNVLAQENVVEALSICESTPGPVPQLVKAAILSREAGRAVIRESLEDSGRIEVARLEEKLNMLGTIAQTAPLLGLFGTTLGLIDIFGHISLDQAVYPEIARLAEGVWQALICTAMGLGVAIFSYVAHNYLVGRVKFIVLDMEKASAEILGIVSGNLNPE